MLSAAADLRALRDLVRKYRSERPDHEVPFMLQLSAARIKAATSLQCRFHRPERAGQLLRDAAQLAAYCRA